MGSLRMKAAVLLLLRLSLEKTTVAATPCGTDADCPYGASGWRCCGASLRAENCPPPANESAADVGPCVLPGTTGRTMCTCVPGRCGDSRHYKPKIDGQRQWLMIGDSISMGCVSSGLPNVSASHGIQLVHSPGNAANVWWGAHCLDGWIGDASRWDVITFQFGLHDLALDNVSFLIRFCALQLQRSVLLVDARTLVYPIAAITWRCRCCNTGANRTRRVRHLFREHQPTHRDTRTESEVNLGDHHPGSDRNRWQVQQDQRARWLPTTSQCRPANLQ
eukprot:SAG31_NODE_366_length_16817_cov_17.317921_10_plen_277_part_00